METEVIALSISSLDLLYFVLSICAIVLTIFLSILIYRAIKLLRNLNQIWDLVENALEVANVLMMKPIQFLDILIEYLRKILLTWKKK